MLHFRFLNQTFWLSPLRFIYWEEQNTILVADIHFGKVGHFRKNGIAVPQSLFKEDIQHLTAGLTFHKAKRLIVVGDFFHSHINEEMELFLKWRRDFAHIQIDLIKGNHDILPHKWYEEAFINLHTTPLIIDNQFCFVHDIDQLTKEEKSISPKPYYFTGHVHPGASLKGVGKQSLRFPCFYFGEAYAILPAFSRFSGLSIVKRKRGEATFAIVNQEVIEI